MHNLAVSLNKMAIVAYSLYNGHYAGPAGITPRIRCHTAGTAYERHHAHMHWPMTAWFCSNNIVLPIKLSSHWPDTCGLGFVHM